MSGPTAKVRAAVYDRDAGCCCWCGRPCLDGAHSLQHRRARGMGSSSRPGTNGPANLILACGTGSTGDHGRMEAAPELARHYGYRLFQGQEPSQEPVWTARHGWILLDDLGGFQAIDDPDPVKTEMLQRISLAILEAS